jgi:alpha-galactosidase
MKRLWMVAAGAMLAVAGYGADLNGHWVATQTLADGQTRETAIWIKVNGDAFTGYTWTEDQGNQSIVDGKVAGDQITFVVVADNTGVERRIEYSARITTDGMAFHRTAVAGRGGTVRELIARRVSSDDPPPMPQKIVLGAPQPVKSNGLAATPPMGWNSWNKFRDQVSDKLVRETADAMVRNVLRDAGYIYLNIDDTWEATRDADGNIRSNDRFPDMKAMIDYVHSKGLKFGIYSSPGPKTCAGYLGSFQHEEQDAKTYAAWGVDYLKYDWCTAAAVYQASSMQAVYAKMGEALLHSGRPIVFSLCQYGLLKVQDWAAQVGGNLWRTTGDISDNWKSMSHIGFDQQMGLESAAGPGHWHDRHGISNAYEFMEPAGRAAARRQRSARRAFGYPGDSDQ